MSRARATTPARSTHRRPPWRTCVQAAHAPDPAALADADAARGAAAAGAGDAGALDAAGCATRASRRRRPARGPLVVPDFAEAGRPARDHVLDPRGPPRRVLRPDARAEAAARRHRRDDCTIYEDRSRPNYFMEVFRFKDEAEFTAFDDKFHKDRKIAAIYALLDDIVEAEKSDFKIFERRL